MRANHLLLASLLAFAASADTLVTSLVTAKQLAKSTEQLSVDTWIRPGDWLPYSAVVSEPVSVTDISFSTNRFTGCVYSNSVSTQSYSLSADLASESLDELATDFDPGEIVYTPMNGGTVNGTRFTATTAGVYRIQATSSKLGIRYCDVPLMTRQGTTSNATVYVADAALDGLWRKSVNDTALQILNAATPASASAVANGEEYTVWWTIRNPCRPISGHTVQGFRSRNALSPHLVLSARHYCAGAATVDRGGIPVHKDWNESWLTFRDGSGNEVSVHTKGGMTGYTAYDVVPIDDGCGFPLAMWAMTNGFTRAEIAEMNIDDVEVHPVLDGATIPAGCCPYFATAELLGERFGYEGRVMGWANSQTYAGRTGPDGIMGGNYMTPCSVAVAGGLSSWSCAAYLGGSAAIRREIRADILARLDAMQSFPSIFGGDSSGGIYLYHDAKWIMISQYKTISSGPALSKALPVLRKLCAAYGDTLKEIAE